MSDLRGLIKEYLEKQKLMQLATVSEGNPWVCSVWQVIDDELNIYFFSALNRRHSKEIAKDNRVAGALAMPHTPEDPARGLQFEGTVQKLSSSEDIKHARSLYEGRIFDAQTIDNFLNHKEKQHFFYKITPTKFVLFDTENFPEESRQEYDMNKEVQ